jgi:hypothetical protein
LDRKRSWTIGPYRADVDGGGESAGHDHTGNAGAGGAFTPDVLDGGAHTPTEIGTGAHDHQVNINPHLSFSIKTGYLVTSGYTDYESSHTHPKGSTGGPDDTANAVTGLSQGCECSEACGGGHCITGTYVAGYAEDSHWHLNTGLVTGAGSSHRHILSTTTQGSFVLDDLYFTPFDVPTEPAHIHTINYVAAHPHTGVAEGAHSDHTIVTEAAADIDLTFGIHEEAAGTTLELLVNSEVVASSYVGDQTDIRIDGYLSTGNNTVEIRPIVGENAKKGSCTTLATGIFFIEAKK